MASKALSGRNDSSDGKDSQRFTYASAVTSPRSLEERSPPVSSSNEDKFPIEAAEPAQHIHRKVSHHHCMYADLWRHNYVKKFEELVKCEQKTHLNILQAKCSGNCTLVVTDAPPHKNDAEPSYVQYGHLIGLSDDQIAYVSQSADRRNGVIIKAKNRENEVCRAAILRSNFSHTDTKLYIAFDEDNKIKVWQRFKDALTQKQRVKVHVKFDLKNSYFRNLSQSVHRVSQAIIVKIMPDAQTTCTLDHENLQLEKHLPSSNFSEDQMQALKMILGSSSNGPPCLITGPFGTGKSHLLAAAAYWLFNESRNAKKPARILVCTQQRESTDNFCSLFRDFMLGDKEATIFIVRDYGFHNPKLRKWYRTVNEFKEYMGNFESKEMENFLIIMPCLTSLSVQKTNFLPPDFFTHIFIDEAAQMREPEAIAPLSMASENTKVVIAGDPWQFFLA